MDEVPKSACKTTNKKKVSVYEVQTLMQMYPKLDYLMAETILSFSEEELGEILEKNSGVSIDDNKIGKVES
jgi:hypothetical protein